MNKELQQCFFKRFPELFLEHTLPPSESCMHWGITCSEGWKNLLERLCQNVQGYINSQHKTVKSYYESELRKQKENPEHVITIPIYAQSKVPQVVFKQIKEKFGHLTIYYVGGNEYIKGLVNQTEFLSNYVCETCGDFGPDVGKITKGWIHTICLNCAIK